MKSKKITNLKCHSFETMPGRRPIFASLIASIFWGTRDLLFKVTLEPASHDKRKAKEAKKDEKKKS